MDSHLPAADPIVEPPPLPASGIAEASKQPSNALLIWNILLFCFIQLLLLFVMPVFAAMFADFGAELPFLTRALIQVSDIFKGWWWCLNPVIVGFTIGIFALSEKRLSPRTAHQLLVSLQAVLLILVAISMFLPIFQLGEVAKGLQ